MFHIYPQYIRNIHNYSETTQKSFRFKRVSKIIRFCIILVTPRMYIAKIGLNRT